MTSADSGADPAPAEPRHRVLVVDDEDVMRKAWRRVLRAADFDVELAGRADEALAALERAPFDVVVLDISMPGQSGMQLLPEIKRRWPEIEVVMMTGYGGVDAAVQAVKLGAYEFLTKPFPSIDGAALVVRNAAAHKRLVDRARLLEAELRQREADARDGGAREAGRRALDRILGDSPAMREVVRTVEAVAASAANVLVQGESGTGKELVARTLAACSPRRNKPFLAVNCAALPDALLESELYGHLRGAFPGAVANKVGLFAAASGGTLFLDEIGEVSPAMQAKLLRVLHDGEVKPVGGNDVQRVDVRIVAASNDDLQRRCQAGAFREDLYYRLAVITVSLPPLRDRRSDVALLAYHFLRRSAERAGKPIRHIAPDALEALAAFAWPGNVRELENAIERAVMLGRGDTITVGDLPAALQSRQLAAMWEGGETPLGETSYSVAKERAMRAFDRVYVQTLLERTGGNISESARIAGLDRSNFRRVIKRARLDE